MTMFPIAFGIIREVLPEKMLAIGQTIFSSTFSGGAVVGLVGGAAIIQNFGWQATFLALLPVTIAVWLIIVKFIRIKSPAYTEQEIASSNANASNDQTIDIKGTVAPAATIITFLAGISFLEDISGGGDNTSGVYQVAGLFAASAVSFATFIAIEESVFTPT